MAEEVKAEFPVGKTQWAKWGPEARKAFNRCGRLGFTFATCVAEVNAVQAKAPEPDIEEIQLPPGAFFPEAENTEKTEKTETVQPAKKPRAPRAKKAK